MDLQCGIKNFTLLLSLSADLAAAIQDDLEVASTPRMGPRMDRPFIWKIDSANAVFQKFGRLLFYIYKLPFILRSNF